jgi:hypothetical protein
MRDSCRMKFAAAATSMAKSERAWWILSAIIIIVLVTILFVFRPSPSPSQKIADGFATGPGPLTFCPGTSKQYISKNGDTMCCAGDVNGSTCNGDIICTFATPKNGIPSCKDMYKEYASKSAAKFCPKEMPNFFTMREGLGGIEGCTASGLKTDTYEPINTTADHCIVYKSATDNNKKSDSCLNKKRLSEMKCVTPNCTKFQRGAGVIGQVYSLPGQSGVMSCITKESAMMSGNTSSSDPSICEIAYKKYVEKRVV